MLLLDENPQKSFFFLEIIYPYDVWTRLLLMMRNIKKKFVCSFHIYSFPKTRQISILKKKFSKQIWRWPIYLFLRIHMVELFFCLFFSTNLKCLILIQILDQIQKSMMTMTYGKWSIRFWYIYIDFEFIK